MSINFKAINKKPKQVLIEKVNLNSYIEFNKPNGQTVIGKVFTYNIHGVKATGLNDGIEYELPYGTLCNIVENIDIHYKYKHKEYTDKERLDFLDKHCIAGNIESKKGNFYHNIALQNTETIRQTIDEMLEHFEGK